MAAQFSDKGRRSDLSRLQRLSHVCGKVVRQGWGAGTEQDAASGGDDAPLAWAMRRLYAAPTRPAHSIHPRPSFCQPTDQVSMVP